MNAARVTHQVWLVAVGALALGILAWTRPSRAEGRVCLTVTDHGANGRDSAKDTEPFQKAIDACCKAGGGVVVVPPGTYLLGRVILKDNVTLELQGGAVLRPSTDPADYPHLAGSPDSNYRSPPGTPAPNRIGLLYAYKAKNIAVTGRGKLLGDGQSFWDRKNTGDFPKWTSTAPWHYFSPKPGRPMLLLFEDCQNTLVRDIGIEDSPVYSGWFLGCKYMKFENITIRNDPAGPNTDGFHFSSCQNVHVTDCDFVCGDDCIAIDPNHHGPATNFAITGCTFNTTVNVFRIYTGLDTGVDPNMPRGHVRDISATNCSIEDASGVFNVTAEKGDIERLTFSNFSINMETRGSAFFLVTLAGGTIRDVVMNNMAIRTDGIGTISGEGGGQISGITLDGLRYEVFPRTKRFGNALPDPLPGYAIHHFAPYHLLVRYAKDVKLHNVQINWREADLADLPQVPGGSPNWPAIECKQVMGLDLEGIVCSPHGKGVPAVQLESVKDAMIWRCRAQQGTETFLRVAGDSGNLCLSGNDLTKAAKRVEAVGAAAQKAIQDPDGSAPASR